MSRSVCARAATSAESDGWLVVPAMGALATSTASAPGAAGREQGGELAARGVVGVHVHRQVEALAQRRDELRAAAGPQQPGHVLDREDVRARVDDLLGEAQVVVERVQVSSGSSRSPV